MCKPVDKGKGIHIAYGCNANRGSFEHEAQNSHKTSNIFREKPACHDISHFYHASTELKHEKHSKYARFDFDPWPVGFLL